ncbi:DEAD/DEAH box helicase family protein [Streptomyces sp. FB2]|uniref:type I restriction endonuclease subunit R n=1 Tax=Streptomyces sp. FB2 TaxID=2902454 RepID=UPI001EEA9673|nr:type I restriction endonuclease [Streptomyces sp. FB2]MCF2538162.1 DEAD/DEAH box helicase family protein [Streptomyces sp. FB2]
MARGTVELDEVEQPIIDQLTSMGWKHIHGPDLADPDGGDGRAYSDVLLVKRLSSAIRRLNRVTGTGETWMDTADADSAVAALRRAARNVATEKLKDVNSDVTSLLLSGTPATGHEVHHQGKTVHVQYIDWELEGLSDDEILRRNEYLVVDQLRVRTVDGVEAVLDLVLFVNGIPVAVIECKSPDRQDPVGSAIRDLRAYAGVPLDDDTREPRERPGGVPELFASVQLLIAASGSDAALGTITSTEEHFAAWRSVTPDYKDDEALARALQKVRRADGKRRLLEEGQDPTDQHKLVAIVLKPRNLLNIMRHYVFELPVKTKEGEPPITVKAVCRHQQYRAVEKIVHKLRTGRTPEDPAAEVDERGGVIWHTQGSGKSLTMAFLARRLHTSRDPRLNRFTILVVTDRKQLEQQLSAAVRISGSPVRIAKSQADAEGMLKRAGKPGGRAVIFTMIQKFLGRIPGVVGATAADDDRDPAAEFAAAQVRIDDGGDAEAAADPTPDADAVEEVRRRFTECSTSTSVLVLVDEAHRSHTSVLHACLRDAVPNAARIGFTGTPIMKGRLTDTGRIFGLEPDDKFLDSYLMDEAERDKVVVPVRYEGRTGSAEVREKDDLNAKFDDLVAGLREEDKDRFRNGLKPTSRDVAESLPLIRRKAMDMLEHYVTGPLTGGFKAQVAAVSRHAVVLYRHMLNDARAELLARVREFDPATLRHKDLKDYSWDELVLLRAWQYQELLRRIDFVPVISAGSEQKQGLWREWTDPVRQQEHIERFLEPFPELPPDNPWVIEHVPEPDPMPGGGIGMNPWSEPERPAAASGANPWSAARPPLRTASASDANPWSGAEQPPIAFLIVKSMLLTGFDAPIEQALYLDRPIQDAELLQAIARVNRPRQGKHEGRVVDYYGVLNDLAVTLPAYKGDGPTLRTVRSLTSEVPDLRKAAGEVERFLAGMGIGGLDSPEGITGGMRALGDEDARAVFDEKLAGFFDALERVLPHQGALEQVPNARRWALLQKRVRRHYRDASGGEFSMRAYGRKVRAMVADHLELPEIQQVIAPVSILAPDFDEAVGRISDVEESAAEQVQALRYHLEERQEQDDRPVYRTLAEELERILEEFDGRWDEIKVRIGPMIDRARKAEEADPAVADLSPVEQQLYTKLSERLADNQAFDQPGQDFLRQLTIDLTSLISRHVAGAAWSGSESSLDDLQSAIWRQLRDAGLKPKERDRKPLRDLSESLTGHAQRHAAAFRALRRER